MNRVPGWRKRLEITLDELERQPFDWNGADCASGWAAKAVEALLGWDPAADYRGRYTSAAEALALIREHECPNLVAFVTEVLTEKLGVDCNISPAEARVGDLVAIPDDSPFGCSLGIVNGERVLVRRADGKGTVDRRLATVAWRIGDA